MTIKPGEHVALVGHSGAGKSTIAALLNRFYDVTGGRIVVDGTNLNDLDIRWWRSNIGLVLQENLMFNDTVLENIRYARPSATLDEVMLAAKRASADEFIERLPKKYDTEIGERGVKLSGGERQRLAIARAILKDPKIVILDEATSALDSLTERKVQEGIKELIAGRTAVIIAHRLSTVRSVDRIAVMEGGKLQAMASHDELLKTNNLYRQMVELQQGGVLPE
jgi:ABC-type multidrug transport system fused ATPase/permease subunit